MGWVIEYIYVLRVADFLVFKYVLRHFSTLLVNVLDF